MSDWVLVFHDAAAPSAPCSGRGRGPAARRHRPRHALGPRGRRPGAPEPDPRRADPGGGGGGGDTVPRSPPRDAPRPPPGGRPCAPGTAAIFEGQPPLARPGRRARGRGPHAGGRGPRGRRVGAGAPRGRSSRRASRPRTAASDRPSALPVVFSGAPPRPERIAGCVALEGPSDPSPFHEATCGSSPPSRTSRRAAGEPAAARGERRQAAAGRGPARRPRIQESLLPEETPALPGWELAASSRLCSAVGADYYDFSPDAGGLLLALGDVAGKGLAAALLMASLRAAVRALWREEEPLPRRRPRQRQPLADGAREPLRDPVPRSRRHGEGRGALGERRPRRAAWSAPPGPGSPRGHRDDPRGVRRRGVGRRANRARPRRRARPVSDGVMEAARASATDLDPECPGAAVAPPAARLGALAALQAAAEQSLGGARRADDHTFVVLRRQA